LFCRETLIEHGPGGELVGVDPNGNKYFEKKDAQVGRNRWVVYAKADDWRTQDPSAIPAEWHAWLHAIDDRNPSNADFVKPVYAIQAKAHPTMSSNRYVPKGSWENPNRRNWRKYESWIPPPAKGTHA
jgi:NADH:ubiquinone oxidoreductase subunit